jgi:hypothetical protein
MKELRTSATTPTSSSSKLYSFVGTLAASHRRFHNLIKTHGRTPLDEKSAHHKGLYLHRTTQNRNTKTNIHALNEIRTHDPSNQAAKNYALDHAAIGDGSIYIYIYIYIHTHTQYLKLVQNHYIIHKQTTSQAMALMDYRTRL